MSVFTCNACYRDVDSDDFPCELVRINTPRFYIDDKLICETCLMELVEAVRDGSSKDFELWNCMTNEYVSVFKLINENKL
jgi:hypothetical protein